MARTTGTTENAQTQAEKGKKNDEVVEINTTDTAELALLDEAVVEEAAKEQNKQAKSALTRLEKAVENAREKGWTVNGRVSRQDLYGKSEGTEL